MNKITEAIAYCCLLLAHSCISSERGFRHQSSYIATQSGYQLEVISQGIRDGDSDSTISAYKLVQICPLQPHQGRPLQFSISSEQGNVPMLVPQDQTIPARDWAWNSQAIALQQTLTAAGYKNQDLTELRVMASIIDQGIYVEPLDMSRAVTITTDANSNTEFKQAPATAMEPGQNLISAAKKPASVTTIQEAQDYSYQFDRSRPLKEWVSEGELQKCG
jgi:hypothetical protein